MTQSKLLKSASKNQTNGLSLCTVSWVVHAGLLTPLTFARHHLSPLAAFTFGVYFLHNESGDSEFANFTLPTLKAFFEACSQNASGNKK